MKTLKFTKMHNLGNDFMVTNAIKQGFDPLAVPLAQWADRYRGAGLDQLLVVEKPSSDAVDFRYRIFNTDGWKVEQCGNGARCFTRSAADKGLTDRTEISVEMTKGIAVPKLLDNGLVTVNVGKPRFIPSEILFVPTHSEAEDALAHIVLVGLEFIPVSCMNMGNPHAVILVDNVETAPVGHRDSAIEPREQFPERIDVGFMQIEGELSIQLRVFEREVRETQACGTGACAAVVAGVRSGLLKAGMPVRVTLPDGELFISWEGGGNMQMTGPAETIFEGELQYS